MAMSNLVLKFLKHNLACITSNLYVCMWCVCICFTFEHMYVKTRLISDISFSHVPLFIWVGFVMYPEHSHLITPASQFTTAILHLCLQNTGFAAGTPNQLWFHVAEGWNCNAGSHTVMLYSLICLPSP